MSPPKKKISFETLKRAFRTILWPRRKLLLIGFGLILISRAAGLVLPGSTKFLIDNVMTAGNFSLLWPLLAVVFFAVLVQAATGFVLTRLLSVEAQNLIAQLRVQVQKHIIRLPVRFFDNSKSGELVSRIMNDVEGVRNLVGTGLVQLVGGILTAAVSFVILLYINPWMTFAALVPLAIFGLVSFRAFALIRPIFRERGQIQAEVTGRLTETLGGIRVVKGFHAEEREIESFRIGTERLFNNVKKSLTTIAMVTSAATLLLGVASILVMGLGGTFVLRETLTVGDFVAFTLYLAFLVAPILQMSNIGSQITEAFAGLDRMEEILSKEPEGAEPERIVDLKELHGDIRFDNVTFSYSEGKEVLHGISLEAPSGSLTALVGSSGSGKSTIAGLVASFLTPSAGRVTVDGVELSHIRLDRYRSRLGVVLQDEFLFDGTIRENILFPRPHAGEAALMAAVEDAYVKEFTDRLPEGLETIIGERGIKLSGGQRQRLAIARALLADPRILILDEATSSLDGESERLIQTSLERLMRGRTTFVIAHRLSTIRQADQILVVEGGVIVERGRHEELLESKGRYHELYTYQARI